MGKGYHFWGHLEIPLIDLGIHQELKGNIRVFCRVRPQHTDGGPTPLQMTEDGSTDGLHLVIGKTVTKYTTPQMNEFPLKRDYFI